jgi:uncharacterized protein
MRYATAIGALLTASGLFAARMDSRLADAEKRSDKAAVRALLGQHVDVNAPAVDGDTALHWAAYWDDLDTAALLLKSGADVNAVNRYGVTPLSLACTNGSAAMIDLFLKAKADPNAALPGGETPLMTAARTGKADAIKLLLAKGADVKAKDAERGQTALMWAAAEGNTAAAGLLIESGADIHAVSKGGFTTLMFAVREGKSGVVRTLLKAGADVNETLQKPARQAGTSAMALAVANAHFELAAMLLDAGADPNAAGQGWTALHTISWIRQPGYASNDPAPMGSGNMSSLEFVKKIVAKGANLNAKMTRRTNVGLAALTIWAPRRFCLPPGPVTPN